MKFFSLYRIKCRRCVNNIQVKLPPEDSDCASDLSQWFHCSDNSIEYLNQTETLWHSTFNGKEIKNICNHYPTLLKLNIFFSI
jgi:hypothetical protein